MKSKQIKFFIVLMITLLSASHAFGTIQLSSRSEEMIAYSGCDQAGSITLTFDEDDFTLIHNYLATNDYVLIRVTLSGIDIYPTADVPLLCRTIATSGPGIIDGIGLGAQGGDLPAITQSPAAGYVALNTAGLEVSNFSGGIDIEAYVYGGFYNQYFSIYIVDIAETFPDNPWIRIGDSGQSGIFANVSDYGGLSKLTCCFDTTPIAMNIYALDNQIGHFLVDIDNDLDGYSEHQGDCNDADASIHPGATEICGDGIDQDCSGSDEACLPEPSDVDNDGLSDVLEENICTDPFDADTDDDGIPDGTEDADQNGIVDIGETDPCDSDTDSDGVQDGTESGYTLDVIGADTDQSFFQPDEDSGSNTDPTNEDTDGDGALDGEEDLDQDGAFEVGETNPINSGSQDDNLSRTAVKGTVTYNGTPVTAMVLANGEYMFTGGGEGRFDLTDVPFDSNGEITVFAFCSGLAPYEAILSAGAYNLEIEMLEDQGGNQLIVTIDSISESSIKTGWYDISGNIENEYGTPLVAMVLANGEYMFTNNPVGEFSLTVPLDDNGEVTLFGFCSGLSPYRVTGVIDILGQF